MSHLLHCDGPDCDESCDPDSHLRSFSTPSWITVETDVRAYKNHFHSRECLAKWAAR